MPGVTWTERRVQDLFSDNESIGDVVRFTALLDFELDCLLAQYFVREDRINEGMSLLIANLNFGGKVETLARLPVRKSVASFQRAVTGLRRFRRVRNTAAHRWTISLPEVRGLLNGVEYKKMLVDYPVGLREDFNETRKCLWRLSRVREFLGVDGKRTVNAGMLAIARVMS
jgi:hypothetical protein